MTSASICVLFISVECRLPFLWAGVRDVRNTQTCSRNRTPLLALNSMLNDGCFLGSPQNQTIAYALKSNVGNDFFGSFLLSSNILRGCVGDSFFPKILSLLWTGRWTYLQIFSWRAMTWKTSSVISCGLEVEKRIRISGTALATISNSWAKLTALIFAFHTGFVEILFSTAF